MAEDAAHGSFLDSLGRLFRGRGAAPAAPPPAPEAGFAKVEAAFDDAIRALQQKLDAQRAAGTGGGAGGGAGVTRATPEERAAERARRIEAVHRAMREDVEAMHAKLGTGLGPADLDALRASCEELAAAAAAGKGSHDLLPRARWAIAERLHAEAGELAVARVVALLRGHGMGWPDPNRPPASATPEEVERAHRRRLADVRRAFLADGLAHTGEGLTGVVKGWGADYPDRGSPLWEACALEAVAAGVRAAIVRDAVAVLRRDREALLAEAETTVGKEIAAMQDALAGGVRSLDQAGRAMEGALRVVDEVLPALAWERVRAALPEARAATA